MKFSVLPQVLAKKYDPKKVEDVWVSRDEKVVTIKMKDRTFHQWRMKKKGEWKQIRER